MTTVKILVKKFYLAHEGRLYKAGEVVEVADEALAKRLLARAHGDMEVYRGQEALDADDGEATQDEAAQNATDEESNMSDSDVGGTELPALDPAAVVQTNGSKAKSKSK